MKKLKILIGENKRLLGYCDFGEMEGSIDIEVEDDFVWRGTSMDYVLEEGKLVYSPDLAKIKSRKRDTLKKIRDEKILENIDVHGSNFQVRERDMENFEDVARAIRRERKQLTDERAWILSDNSIKTFTYAQLLDVLDERALRKEKIFEEYAKYSMILEKATSVEEIEKITWE